MKRATKVVSFLLPLACALASNAVAQELYVNAVVGTQGQLIITADGRTVVLANTFDVELDSQQVAFRAVALSPDRRTVGWVAWFTNGGSPFPRRLEVYSDGRRRTIADRVAVSDWCFLKGGHQLALLREQLNGDPHPVYDLVETATGKELARFSPEDPKQTTVPDWVVALRARR